MVDCNEDKVGIHLEVVFFRKGRLQIDSRYVDKRQPKHDTIPENTCNTSKPIFESPLWPNDINMPPVLLCICN